MVTVGRLTVEMVIPEEIKSIKVDNSIVTVKGKLGELTRDFAHTRILIEKKDNSIVLSTYFPRKKEKAILYTVKSHLNNMMDGITYGYEYKLKIVFSHFPIRVNPEPKNRLVKIENLYGGRSPRYAKILGDVKVKVDGEDVVVTGINKELVGQTCANIQELTRQRGKRRKSPKTFMDGVFTFQKKLKKD